MDLEDQSSSNAEGARINVVDRIGVSSEGVDVMRAKDICKRSRTE